MASMIPCGPPSLRKMAWLPTWPLHTSARTRSCTHRHSEERRETGRERWCSRLRPLSQQPAYCDTTTGAVSTLAATEAGMPTAMSRSGSGPCSLRKWCSARCTAPCLPYSSWSTAGAPAGHTMAGLVRQPPCLSLSSSMPMDSGVVPSWIHHFPLSSARLTWQGGGGLQQHHAPLHSVGLWVDGRLRPQQLQHQRHATQGLARPRQKSLAQVSDYGGSTASQLLQLAMVAVTHQESFGRQGHQVDERGQRLPACHHRQHIVESGGLKKGTSCHVSLTWRCICGRCDSGSRSAMGQVSEDSDEQQRSFGSLWGW